MRKVFLPSFLFLFFLVAGCCSSSQSPQPELNPLPGGGTETGNPINGNILLFSYRSSTLTSQGGLMSLVPLNLSLSSFEIKEAFLTVKAVQFTPEGECSRPPRERETKKFDEDFVQDLLAQGGEKRGTGITVEQEPYCEIVVKFGPAPLEISPDKTPSGYPLAGKSLFILGEYQGRRLVVATAASWTTTFSPQNGSIDFEKTDEYLMLALDQDLWFKGLEMPDAETIEINETSSSELLVKLLENLFKGMGIFLDENGDAELGAAELEEPATVSQSEPIADCFPPFAPNHPANPDCDALNR